MSIKQQQRQNYGLVSLHKHCFYFILQVNKSEY